MTTAVIHGEGLAASSPSRAEIEKAIEPIIWKCQREFGDSTKNVMSDELFDFQTRGMFRPDIRRVSLIVSFAQSLLGADESGEGLEVGCGYCYLLFPMALFLPRVRWTAIDHPNRAYERRDEFVTAFRQYNCQFAALDIIRQPLPFPDAHFAIVTFSEVLEHLPVERLNFVLSEVARVIRPGGLLIVSSPNQASLENRLRLLSGKSILAMPNEIYSAGVFGHIRLYTPSEMESVMSQIGFHLVRSMIETNVSGYRGTSPKSWRRRLYRLYEWLEERLVILRSVGDTWYMAFRKDAAKGQ